MSDPYSFTEQNETGFVMNDTNYDNSVNFQSTNFSIPTQTETVDFASQSHTSNSSTETPNPNSHTSKPDEEGFEVENPKTSKDKEHYHFYQSGYYQQWFDIDTTDVLKRMFWGLIPFFGNFFDQIDENQDLYGPIWISLSVVFLTFFSGSLGGMVSGTYEYIKLSVITGTVLVYLIVIPIILYLVMRCGLKIKHPITKYFCLFGYSYTAYLITIPLCAIQVLYVQIPLICIGCIFQSMTVLKNLFQLMYTGEKKNMILVLVVLAVLLVINLGVAAVMIYCVYSA